MTPWYTLPETSSSRLKRWRPNKNPKKKMHDLHQPPFFSGTDCFFLNLYGRNIRNLPLSMRGCSQILVGLFPLFPDPKARGFRKRKVFGKVRLSGVWFLRVRRVCFQVREGMVLVMEEDQNMFVLLGTIQTGRQSIKIQELELQLHCFFWKMVMFKNGVWWYLFCLGLWLFYCFG